jgi:tetratricopeptide (TPR) repeat protein
MKSYDSIALFVERASHPGFSFALTSENASLVASLCRRLDGVALAIEVVAARVSSPGLAELRSLLDDQRAAQMLSATIAWSHALLNAAERVLFRRLARFTNGWSMRGAEAVCAGDGLPAHAVADMLTSLIEKSLVVVEEHFDAMRYRFLESTRSFAQTQLVEACEVESTARRHAVWFADLADIAAASELVMPRNLWHSKYRSDLEDAGLAADWCLEDGHEPVLAIRIVAGFRGIWMHIGRRAEIASRVQPALQQIDPHDVKHVALLYRVINAVVGPSHDFNLALDDFADRAKDVFERAGDIAGLAALHGNLAFQLSVLGEFQKAREESKTALAYYRKAGAGRSLAYVPYLIHHGLNQLELDDPGARETLREAVELSRSLKDDDMLGYALSATAVAAFAAGDARRALRILQKTFAKQLSIADTSGVATRSVDLAAYHVAVGDKRGSIRFSRIAIDKTRGRFTYGFFTALHHLAAALAMNGLLVEGARTAGYLRMLSKIHGFRGTLLERHSLAEYERLVHVGLAPEVVAAEENTGAALGEAELLEQVALSLG